MVTPTLPRGKLDGEARIDNRPSSGGPPPTRIEAQVVGNMSVYRRKKNMGTGQNCIMLFIEVVEL